MEMKFQVDGARGYGTSLLRALTASGRQDPFGDYVMASANDTAAPREGKAEDVWASDEHDYRPARPQRDRKNPPSSIGLRLIGLLLIALSAAGTYALSRLVHMPGHIAALLDCFLAVVVFVTASAGSLMLCLGAHIFDEVAVSSRWRTRR